MTNNSDPDIEARLEDIERRLEEQDAVHAAEHVDLDAQLDDLEERQRALRHDLDVLARRLTEDETNTAHVESVLALAERLEAFEQTIETLRDELDGGV